MVVFDEVSCFCLKIKQYSEFIYAAVVLLVGRQPEICHCRKQILYPDTGKNNGRCVLTRF